MHTLREAVESLWTRLNPKEPGPAFLALFFGAAMLVFLVGFWIGQG